MNVTLAKKALGVLGALVVLCIGVWWGGHPADLPSFLRGAFVASSHDLAIDEALGDIQQTYYRPVGRAGLVNAAIAGVVASLDDPYATYESPKTYDAFTSPKPTEFSGIGVSVVTARTDIVVEAVFPGSPAARAGLLTGDEITAVDGRTVAALGASRATSEIRGRAGTTVTLEVRRGGGRLTFRVRRAVVSEPLVIGEVKTYEGVKLGVIELSTFDVPGVHAQVAETLESLLHQHVKGIVLDLRDNLGGLVTEAQLVASMFIAHGVIVTMRARTQSAETVDATGHPIAPTIPLAVLVNRDTASAAEIVTGALQDHHRAVVVGTRTYGKGVFQQIQPLSNGGAIVITVGRYYLPDGKNLGGSGLERGPGIKPNVLVTAAPTATSDPQLTAALRVLAARAR